MSPKQAKVLQIGVNRAKAHATKSEARDGRIGSQLIQRTVEKAPRKTVGCVEEQRQQHNVQPELELSHQGYADLYDFAPVGYLTLSCSGLILNINAAGAQILGVPHARLFKSPLRRHVSEPDRRKLLTHFSLCRSRGDRMSTELRLKFRQGARPVFVELISQPVVAPAGGEQGFLSIITDITIRKHAELALRESEERFRTMTDAVPVLIWMTRSDKSSAYFNQRWLEFTGRTLHEELEAGRESDIHPDDLVRWRNTCRRAIRARQEFKIEYRLRRRDGEYRWVLDHGVPRMSGDHGFRGYIGSCIDITERKQMEKELRLAHDALDRRVTKRTRELTHANELLVSEIAAREQADQALRESEERHRLMVEGTRDYAIFMLDPHGRVATWNVGAQQIVGYRPKEILGHHFSRLYPDMHARKGRAHKLLLAARATGRAEDEGWRVRKNGSRFWASTIITALRGTNGNLRGFLKVTRDITERRQAEEALRLRERSLGDFFNQAPFGLLWVRPDKRVIRINKAGLDIFGCNSEQILSHRLDTFFSDPETATPLFKILARREVIKNHHARIRRKNGMVRHVLIDANAFWEQGRMVRSSWFIRDITRRVELEREILVIAERERQRLGRDLHDDLCQQLTGIEFLSQTLAGHLADCSETGAARAREIARMVRDAITGTRELARGLSPVRLDSNGLADALQELADRIGKLFKIDCRFVCRLRQLHLEPALGIHLFRIAQEAVSNSLKHGHANRVVIGLTRVKHRLALAVKDDGIGMPYKSRKRKGMGLRVMQYRAGAIGGTLVFQRRPEGGTTVVCTVSNGFSNRNTKSNRIL